MPVSGSILVESFWVAMMNAVTEVNEVNAVNAANEIGKEGRARVTRRKPPQRRQREVEHESKVFRLAWLLRF